MKRNCDKIKQGMTNYFWQLSIEPEMQVDTLTCVKGNPIPSWLIIFVSSCIESDNVYIIRLVL